MRRERPFQAWLQISQGCNSTCSYCIVPSVRGREQSRPAAALVAEAERFADEGVRELTLLGQNVNSWGRDLPLAERRGFGELLRLLDAVPGIERIRYTSPHPKDMRDDVIAAHRECASVCEHVHLPLQSGSTRILKAMRRTYTRERFIALAHRLRESVPGLALTTDVIVGFPGETEAEFAETLAVCEEVSFDHAFTFIYSPRRGTDAARMHEQVAEDVKRERLERLVEVIQRHARERNQPLVGTLQEVLVEGPSRTERDPPRPHADEQDRAPERCGAGRDRERSHRGGDLADAAGRTRARPGDCLTRWSSASSARRPRASRRSRWSSPGGSRARS